MENLKEIALNKIEVGTSNPRTTFDEKEIKNLADSIKQQGLLQPILVRPISKTKYELVFGERRFRAFQLNKAKTIHAEIRELDDKQVLELQLTENLQRENVNPIEEGIAFHTYINTHNVSIKETALFFGVPHTKVRIRLKLVNLIEEFHPVYYAKAINTNLAIKLAQLPKDAQLEIFKDDFNGWEDETFDLNDIDWSIKHNETNLDKEAFFDLKTVTDNNLKACNTCAYNKATTELFDTDNICSNQSCFDKKQADFLLNSCQDKSLKGFTLISTYGTSDDLKELFENNGLTFLDRSTYTTIYKPTLTPFDEYKEEWFCNHLTEEERVAKYEVAKKEHAQELKTFNAELKAKTIKKAFIIHTLEEQFIKLDEVRNNTNSTDESNPVELSKEVIIQQQIEKINALETRRKELDNEKISNQVYQTCIDSYIDSKGELTPTELKTLHLAISNKVFSWNDTETNELNVPIEKFDDLTVSQDFVNRILRKFIVSELKHTDANPTKQLTTHALHQSIKEKFNDDYQTIVNEQMEKRKIREEKMILKIDKVSKA